LDGGVAATLLQVFGVLGAQILDSSYSVSRKNFVGRLKGAFRKPLPVAEWASNAKRPARVEG